MVPVGNKVYRFSSVNHTTLTINHCHHHRHYHHYHHLKLHHIIGGRSNSPRLRLQLEIETILN